MESIEHLLGKVHNVDCLEFMRQLPDKCVDITLTSPPYNRKRNDKYAFYNDNQKDYDRWILRVVTEIIRISKITFFNIQATSYNREVVYDLIGKLNKYIQDITIWEKTNPIPANGGKSIVNAYEFILMLSEDKIKPNHYSKNIISTSVCSDMPVEHKAVMKKEVALEMIFRYYKKGNIIFDPFMGTGTTAIAANRFSCPWFGCEISAEYCNMATKRIKEFANQIDLF